MFQSTRKSRRHRNPQPNEENKQPFFSKAGDGSDHANGHAPFFQAKLAIGRPGDPYEREADAVAERVVSGGAQRPVAQQNAISSVQRESLATPVEDEKLGTAEARMEKDKLVQEKPEIQRMEEEEPLQMQEEEELQMQAGEEEEPVQMQEEEEEPVQMEAEEEEVQMQEEEEEVQMQEEEEELQAKADPAAPARASSHLSRRIQSGAGKGKPLPDHTRAEMESAFGVDFSGVNVHTGQEAVGMNKELGAQAFTHGKDLYFNQGKFRPESTDGKRLLAHELTHVVQQEQPNNRPKEGTPPPNEKIIQREISDEDMLVAFPEKPADRDEIIQKIQAILQEQTKDIADAAEKEKKQRELLNDPSFAPRLMKVLSRTAGKEIVLEESGSEELMGLKKNRAQNLSSWKWTIRHYSTQPFDTIKSTAELSVMDNVKSKNTNERDWVEIGNVGYTFFLISIGDKVPKRAWLSNMKQYAEFDLDTLPNVWVSGDMLEAEARDNKGFSGPGGAVKTQLIKLLLNGGDISTPEKAVESLDAKFSNKMECKVPGSMAATGKWKPA